MKINYKPANQKERLRYLVINGKSAKGDDISTGYGCNEYGFYRYTSLLILIDTIYKTAETNNKLSSKRQYDMSNKNHFMTIVDAMINYFGISLDTTEYDILVETIQNHLPKDEYGNAIQTLSEIYIEHGAEIGTVSYNNADVLDAIDIVSNW